MADSGLSQDDFRKLLQTPRQPPASSDAESETPRFKAPAPKAPRNTGAVFATPQSIRKKRPRQTPATTPSNYRDRAAERRNNEQQEEVSTEELLQKTTREQDETLDAKQLYEQSKYLGGDVDHTHLVKGLDYSLLEKVRTDLGSKLADAKGEAALDDALDRLGQEGSRLIVDDDDGENHDEDVERVAVRSVMAKNLVHLVTASKQQANELFMPGRMAFVFELADEVGHYADAFALPTTVIRSKADVVRKRTDLQAETELVINKISQIMRPQPAVPAKSESVKKEEKKPEQVRGPPPVIDSDDDIFPDAGTDYVLDEETMEKESSKDKQAATVRNYFGNDKQADEEEEEEEKEGDQMREVSELLSQVKKGDSEQQQQLEDKEQQPVKRRKFEEEEDADAMDIDMYGLGTSALPTSFEDRQRTVAYDSDEEDQEERGGSGSGAASTSLVDQGTHRNKKAQLTRWDFDNEEQWQKYKDSVEIHPKSAFQYGVKLGDGRKRNREQRRGMSDKQKLNRDYQMVKNIMDKKYGTK
ncbi:RED-like protein N-terminal region-domain-containing protein [Zychaea mexicana]|uniref:RED-like protein N-terminal region-domain-containing protein n=1 Tax=Zychaea mexicana TaxID=64656 RepID=UPI0022FF0A40|nr:RED-like protein N-terminal region-domain-containing protein [Zychaea mexicana]KAI9497247.1 RED-like protein N-terminal region-domain-containing protein [Zychaea mexicana]